MKGELQNAKGAIIEKVLSIRGKLYLSTASIHLRSVYHPENNAPTSLSLNGNCIEDLQQVQSSQYSKTHKPNWPPHVLDDRVNGG